MGARIVALGRDDPRFDIVAEMTSSSDESPPCAGDVIIDFSTPAGAERAARIAAATRAALVVGTTGLSAQNLRQLDETARSVPVMIAPNMAVGVAVMRNVAAVAARLLGADFEVALTEAHHVGKRDAPSGTALDLAAAVTGAGRPLATEDIRSVREGDIVGEHALEFRGAAEVFEIRHKATSRDVFALGALRAAAWLAGRPAGRYRIEAALGVEAAPVAPARSGG